MFPRIVSICTIVPILFLGCSKDSVQKSGDAQEVGSTNSIERQTCLEAREFMKRAPEAVVSRTMNFGEYVRNTCSAIARCQDKRQRAQLYREFVQQASCAPFEKIGGTSGMANARDVEIHLSNAHGALVYVAEEVWTRLYLDDATGEEQFAPWFDVIETLQRESHRLGRNDAALFEARIEYVERLFLLFYLEDRRHAPDIEDRTQVEKRFNEVVGRPIRTKERYLADLEQASKRVRSESPGKKNEGIASAPGEGNRPNSSIGSKEKTEDGSLWDSRYKLQ